MLPTWCYQGDPACPENSPLDLKELTGALKQFAYSGAAVSSLCRTVCKSHSGLATSDQKRGSKQIVRVSLQLVGFIRQTF